jgi:hypothetical protein
MDKKHPRDFLVNFHTHAKRHSAAVENKSIADHNDEVKKKVVGILNKVKTSGPELEQLRQTNPKAYESMMELVQTMIGMAKDYVVPRTPPAAAEPEHQEEGQEPMHKAALNLPPGSETTGQQKDAKSRPKIKVTRPQGPVNRPAEIQARTGETTDPRFSTGGNQPLSRKTYATVTNRGQSKVDPEEEANNPR